ncbi:hypothetical protein ACA910_000817 [Epithemia clementina (nom. ined.)]
MKGDNNKDDSQPTSSSASSSTEPAVGFFTKARRTIFPIHGRHEVSKFLLLGSIKFFIILALTLTRDTKDTLVVTQCGAEAIAFLKIYGVLPAATAYIALYSKMSDYFGKKTLFYVTCIPFFVFFGLYDLIIYPNTATLHPSLDYVLKFLPGAASSSGGLAVLAKICANWTSALFYVVAEIYSSVSIGLLFWQFANDVVSVDQAKRFYPLFAQMSGIAPVLAGQYVVRYVSRAADFSAGMHRLSIAVTFAGVMICFFYHQATSYIERTEAAAAAAADQSSSKTAKKPKKNKPKMSMLESAKFLASSEYLRLIAMLVIGYGLSVNFTEVMWKSLVKKQYPDAMDYQRFMGNVSSAIGLCTSIVIFFGVHVIRLLGWRVGAMATPAIMSALAIPFFTCILMGLDSPTRLQIAVVLGTLQSLISKTSKYALFDPTTQMAYIPLDDDSKVKGKAAIDVLGSRVGKSGGSFIIQGLVFVFGNIINAAPVVGVIFYAVLLSWMGAANRLSGLFQAQTEIDNADRAESKKTK